MGLKKKQRRALVLGCGPAGMFATHALVDAGIDVKVYSKKRMSHLFGAQYLHEPIPGLPAIRTSIDYRRRGTPAQYAEKVYGPDLGRKLAENVSAKTLEGMHAAWDIRAAYREAYSRYSDLVIDVTIDNAFLNRELGNPAARRHFDFVINSIPAKSICQDTSHNFVSQKIYAAGDAPERGVFSPVSCEADTVVCDGTDDRAWYRVSNVFGHVSCEWPETRRPPFEGVAEVTKPLVTNCTCWGDILRVGRYGSWTKGVFAHHAYHAANALVRKTRRPVPSSEVAWGRLVGAGGGS